MFRSLAISSLFIVSGLVAFSGASLAQMNGKDRVNDGNNLPAPTQLIFPSYEFTFSGPWLLTSIPCVFGVPDPFGYKTDPSNCAMIPGMPSNGTATSKQFVVPSQWRGDGLDLLLSFRSDLKTDSFNVPAVVMDHIYPDSTVSSFTIANISPLMNFQGEVDITLPVPATNIFESPGKNVIKFDFVEINHILGDGWMLGNVRLHQESTPSPTKINYSLGPIILPAAVNNERSLTPSLGSLQKYELVSWNEQSASKIFVLISDSENFTSLTAIFPLNSANGFSLEIPRNWDQSNYYLKSIALIDGAIKESPFVTISPR